jgi:transcription elongation factor SPT5
MAARRTGRDPIEGLRDVYVTKGPFKGHKGTVKDVNGLMVRIELETSSKLVTVQRALLAKAGCVPLACLLVVTYGMDRRNAGPNDKRMQIDAWVAEQRGGGAMRPMPPPNSNYTQSPYSTSASPMGQAQTPNAFGGGRTPNPYAQAAGGGQGGGRTPNPYAQGAGAGGGRTPNPYTAGVGGRTPNPYGSGVGGRTPNPYSAGVGGKTPNPYADDGSRTPAYGVSSDESWNPSSAGASSSSSWDANSKTPYTSNDDRAGSSSGTTPRYGGGSTPAAIGTGAYGNYQGATPRGSMGGQTPRDTYSGGRSSYGGRDDYGGQASSSSSFDPQPRFGTATNTMALGAPSRYGSRTDAPTPAGGPTPGVRNGALAAESCAY